MNSAEEILSKNYNSKLWNTKKGITEDARQSEDLRACARQKYIRYGIRAYSISGVSRIFS